MKLHIVRFHQFSPKMDRLVLHSDTLFGAICHAICELEGEEFLTEMLRKMEKKPSEGFIVSSGFPFCVMENDFRYMVPLEILGHSESKETKGKLVDMQFFKEKREEIKKYLLEPLKVSYKVRNRVGRDAPTTLFSVPYLEGDGGYTDWGLWIAYCGNRNVCEEAFRFLRDEGIGGDRNISNPCRKVEFDTIEVPDSGNFFVNLSLYVPENNELAEIKEGECWYKIIRRQGWQEVNGVGVKLKPGRYYFTEGSVFPSGPKKEVYGQCGEFKNLKGVFWSGITIPVFFDTPKEVIASLQSGQH